jgi:hypothetical protein
LPETEQGTDASAQYFPLDRLTLVIVRTAFDSRDAVVGIDKAGNQHYRHQPGSRILPDDPANLEATAPGQLYVQEGEVYSLFAETSHCFLAVSCNENFISFTSQNVSQKFAIWFFIVSDQDGAGLRLTG